MSDKTVVGLVLALASAFVINFAYLREHEAAAELPVLSMRRPLQSARLLLSDRSWLLGFAMESGGFLLYVAALALAPLSLVQSIAAGGVGGLAVAGGRMAQGPAAPPGPGGRRAHCRRSRNPGHQRPSDRRRDGHPR